MFRQRHLVAVLVARELKARYRGTLFGYFWSLLNPLLLLLVYTVVFTVVIPARVSAAVPYPLFLFAGLLPWLFLSGALLDSTITLIDNGPLLKKVVCPPEVFPAVVVFSHLAHHLLALPVLLVAAVAATITGHGAVSWTVLLLPVVLLPWLVAVGGVSLAVAALAVHFRDLKDLLHNLLNLMFFTTPIIYTVDLVPEGVLRRLILVNPVTPLVSLYRDTVLLGTLPPLSVWGWSVLVAAVCWLAGVGIFTRLRETLVEAV